MASPFGAQDLPAQLDFEFELGLGRRGLRGPSLLFLVVFLLVFLLVLLVLFLVHSVAVGTRQTQLQGFPCRRRVCQRCTTGAGQGNPRRTQYPEGSYSSRGIRCYHNNSPAFLLPTCGEVPRKLGGARKGLLFCEGLSCFIDPRLPGSGASIAPEVLPRRHSLLMGSCKEKGLKIVGTQADIPFPPHGTTYPIK